MWCTLYAVLKNLWCYKLIYKCYNNIDSDHLKISTAVNRRSLIAVLIESYKLD